MREEFLQVFKDILSNLILAFPRIIMGVGVLLIFVLFGLLFNRVIGKFIRKRWHDNVVSNFLTNMSKWVIFIIGIMVALQVVGFGNLAGNILAGAGISAIILGFAFKDIGENFLAGLILAMKRPFKLGDIIEIDGHKGMVRSLNLRTLHMRNMEGKDIFLPNSYLIKMALINYTRDGLLRSTFMLGIAPESDIKLVRKLILEYFSERQMILKYPEPNVLVEDLGEFTTNIEVLFWTDLLANKNVPDHYLGHTIRSKVIMDIKKILEDNNIQMPSQVLEHKMYRDHKFAWKENPKNS